MGERMQADREQLRELMDRASADDGGAFEELARAVQDDLFRFAVANGLGRPDAAEAVQETLLRAYRGRKRWRRGGDAAAWLLGVAMNVVREFRRRLRRDRGVSLETDCLPEAPSAEDGPEGRDEASPDAASLQRALEALPERQREAVVCRFLRRMSVRDTAAAMGCAEGTVKAAVFAALENLRKALDEGS